MRNSGPETPDPIRGAGVPTPSHASAMTDPFWRRPLSSLTQTEWESLCDGCGRCCLVKLEDEDTAQVLYTDVACTLYDSGACRCGNYPERQSRVPDCVKLTPAAVEEISWLPPTCAYRIVADGGDLPWWHHLVSGSRDTVHEVGVGVRGRIAASEDDVAVEDLPDHIVSWPDRWPKRAKRRPE